MTKQQIRIKSKNEFLKFLDSISIINEACILSIQPNVCSVLSTVPDETIYVLGEYTDIEATFSGSLNVPNLKKLARVLEDINEQSIVLDVTNNSISYEDRNLRFKYHLYDDNFLSKPALKAEKIKKFVFDVSFTLPKNALQTIVKNSAFSVGCKKVYLFTEDGLLKAEIVDREKHNMDSIALTLCDADYELDSIILNLDNLKLVSSMGNDVKININTDIGISTIDATCNSIQLKYILTSLI